MPKISIIIPTYNRANLLGNALRSVIHQREQDWECIIVDDGSTDHTKDVVNEITDRRFVYIYQENRGPAAARNNGIHSSSAEYITFLDSDDQFLPEKLSLQLEAFHSDRKLGMVASGWKDVDERGIFVRDHLPWAGHPTLTLLDWLQGCPVIVPSLMVKRSDIEAVGYFNPDLFVAEDYDLWLRLSLAGCKMIWQPGFVCLRTIHTSGISRSYQKMCRCLLKMFDDFFARSNLPSEVILQRDKVYTRIYIEITGRALAAGDILVARQNLDYAVGINPGLLTGNPPQVLDTLASMALADFASDRKAYLHSWAALLSQNPHGLRRSLRQIESIVSATEAFDHLSRKDYSEARKKAFRAIIGDLGWIKNRGLLKILIALHLTPTRTHSELVGYL